MRRDPRAHTDPMDPVSVTLTPLEPGQRIVMHLEAIVPSMLLLSVGIAIGTAAQIRLGWPAWPSMAATGALALWTLLLTPRRRWAAWGWALDDRELHIAHGVWTTVHTVVPLTRVQHIDVAQGPVERANGVARLVLHTAGTAHAVVILPGISRVMAEQARDTIRAAIRVEVW